MIVKPEELLAQHIRDMQSLAAEISLSMRQRGQFVRGGLEAGEASWMEVELSDHYDIGDRQDLVALSIIFKREGWRAISFRTVPHGTRGRRTQVRLYFAEF